MRQTQDAVGQSACRALVLCVENKPTVRVDEALTRGGRTEPNRSFIRTCRQTDKANGFLFSVYAATSGAVGFGAWFAALRFAPIPSEIRPIVVAVRLSTREE